jgi:hypothetical protein
LDEAQRSYDTLKNNSASFWGTVKECLQRFLMRFCFIDYIGIHKNLSILIFVAYDIESLSSPNLRISTPERIPTTQVISLRPEENTHKLGLLLDEEEFTELLTNFQRKFFMIPTESINLIRSLTNRHAGFVKRIISHNHVSLTFFLQLSVKNSLTII